jgi:hypothetical protein
MTREEIPDATLRKNLPAYVCFQCDLGIKKDAKRPVNSADDGAAPAP